MYHLLTKGTTVMEKQLGSLSGYLLSGYLLLQKNRLKRPSLLGLLGKRPLDRKVQQVLDGANRELRLGKRLPLEETAKRHNES
jgi:hypothetical protein